VTREQALAPGRPQWRIERIVHHEFAPPYKPPLTLHQKAQKGGRAHARNCRIQALIAKIARERRAQNTSSL